MKILVVDDSRAMRRIVQRTIWQAGHEGHEIVEAENGREALDLAGKENPDLILSDWHMPEMDGLEFLKALKEQGSEVPFGFVTSESTREMRDVAAEAGANFLLTKPFTPEDMKQILDHFVTAWREITTPATAGHLARIMFDLPADEFPEAENMEDCLWEVVNISAGHLKSFDDDLDSYELRLPGFLVAEKVEKIFASIAGSVGEVSRLVHEVSVASNEQSSRFEQINATMAQMDAVTQSNAASAEESAASSEELSRQANELQDMVAELYEIVNGVGSRTPHEAAAAGRRIPRRGRKPGLSRLTPWKKREEGALTSKSAVAGPDDEKDFETELIEV